jgi:hypothetical protein
MNFRQITWGVGLLGALALLGCGGDDTPTPTGWEEAGVTGAGGAGNDASASNDSSTGKAGGSATDSGSTGPMSNKNATAGDSGNEHVITAAMAVTGADITECKATLPEAGSDGGEDAGGSSCMACLCGNCPFEAKTCSGNPNCSAVTDCCRAACKACAPPTPEGGSDAHASEGGNDAASTTDSAAGDAAAE